MARAQQSHARDTAGAMAPAGAIALAGPDFEAAGPVFEAAGLDFEAAGLDFGALGTDKDNTRNTIFLGMNGLKIKNVTKWVAVAPFGVKFK